ncbi:AraC family transcriptional regulator [Solwaraspora sp. WMMD406]|uniref:helix-turn-helix domain-containing protein n=1 Tax=Solwaraspora sp. WMMD406 TaxID=3016095 RepID=UPI002417C3E6|nr:AraC family transcriptional regulator [Solwaraspora sp. WMMD406]MDG4763978.1 AraC family transcriptional regulator [Solwaraspora sp. WMMD406]
MGCTQIAACTAVTACLGSPTDSARIDSVARAVAYMTENLSEPQRLSDIAQAALLSPFHFHRVFRYLTSTTPARFLAALRMAEARRLLLTTDLSVTEICIEVGYSSLGTFIGQFSKFTGMSPRRFRVALAPFGRVRLIDLVASLDNGLDAPGPVGTVTGGPAEGGCAVLAMFRSDADAPAGYTVLRTNRLTRIAPMPDGTYRAVALGFHPGAQLSDVLARPAVPADFIGVSASPILIRGGGSLRAFHIALRRPRPIDPPVELTPALLRLVLDRPAPSGMKAGEWLTGCASTGTPA